MILVTGALVIMHAPGDIIVLVASVRNLPKHKGLG